VAPFLTPINSQLNWHLFALSARKLKTQKFSPRWSPTGKTLPSEGVAQTHPRDHYDGIEIKINPSVKQDFAPIKGTGAQLTFSTGLARPFENLTSKLDLITLW
jgi:hypothetical protein